MVKKTVLKNALREIKSSLGRYLSIFAIAALGVGFFAGITAAPYDMRRSASFYYERLNLADYRLVSTYGFDKNDIDALLNLGFDKKIRPTYFADLFLKRGEAEYVARVMAFPDELNLLEIKEGRFPDPDKGDECVIDATWTSMGLEIGSQVTLKNEDVLVNDVYTVVGFVRSPMYPSDDSRGYTDIGSGSVQCAVFIAAENFKYEYYTEVYITADELRGLNCYEDAYKDASARLKTVIEAAGEARELGRYNEIIREAEEKIGEAEAEYKTERQKAEAELFDAKQKLDEARQKLDDAWEELEAGAAELVDANVKLRDGQAQLDKGFADYEAGLAEFNDKIAAAEAELEQAAAELALREDEYEQAFAQWQEAYAMYEYMDNEQKAALDAAKAELDAGRTALDAGWAQYEEGEREFTRERNLGKSKLDDALSELAKAESDLLKGKADYQEGLAKWEDGNAEYEQGEADYEKGLSEYYDGVKKANAEFAKAEAELAKARRDLDDLSEPVWYVFDRDGFPNYTEYSNNADRIANIAKVFPVFFLLVAALVCSTTVSRMVEENRVQVGLFKALGYSDGAIVFKYLLYAVSAATLGCAAGLLGGMKVFPYVIITAYQMMYNIPDVLTPYNPSLSVISLAAACGTVALVVILSIRGELAERPAALMRPKSPKKGKRVFIERIGFIWRRIGFSGKVAVRNIFRYKSRMLMTVIGIAGCAALLLTGFALKDSVGDVVQLQFGKITKYSGFMLIDTDKEHKAAAERAFADNGCDFICTYEKTLVCSYGGKSVEADVCVVEDPDRLGEFVQLKNRLDGEEFNLRESGVLISEKVSSLLGVGKDDVINISKSETAKKQAKIGGVIEYYAGRTLYMSREVYVSLFGEAPEYDVAYFKADDGVLDGLKDTLSEWGHVGLTRDIADSFNDIMSTLDSVIVIIIISAGILAFIVLYNLTNINICERVREIATLKVLGFYDAEVDMYIFRENIMLTLMGTAAGLILGIYLSRFVISTAEVDDVMFGRSIHSPSFVIAAVVTMAFSALVSMFMHFYLKKISMVESLKSID